MFLTNINEEDDPLVAFNELLEAWTLGMTSETSLSVSKTSNRNIYDRENPSYANFLAVPTVLFWP